MRVLKALAGLLLLGALLVGVPVALLAWGAPLALLQVQWSTALLRPDDGTILMGVLSILGWAAWAVLVFTAIVEVVAQLSRQRLRIRVPGTTWLQPVVGALVAMALTPVLSTQADEPAPPVTAHAPVRVERPAESPRTDTAARSPGMRGYIVQPGDELWGVAERELGAGTDWRVVLRCNPGMTVDTALVPGTTIALPADRPALASAAPDAPLHIRVQRGDTLWDLAEKHLGDAHRWPELFRANRDIIADPDEIDIGWRLSLPAPAAAVPPDPGLLTAHPTEDPLTQDRPPEVDQDERPDVNTDDSPSPSWSTDTPSASHDTLPSSAAQDTGRVPEDVVSPSSRTVPATHAHPEPTPLRPAPPRRVETVATPDGEESAVDLLGPIGGVLATSLVAAVVARRHVQLLQREVGRRIATLAAPLQRFFSALVLRSTTDPVEAPGLQPTSVVIGWDDTDDVHVEVERERCVLVTGGEEHTTGMAATVVTSLLCAQWSSSVEVVAVQPHEDWSSAFDDPRLSSDSSPDHALTHLQRLCAQRRIEMGHFDLVTVRADDDRADAWAPVVFVFCQVLQPRQLDRIRECLSLGRVGVSVVASAHPRVASDHLVTLLTIESDTTARLGAAGEVFQPQLLTRPARHAVMSLFASALDERTEPAPWWRHGAPAVLTGLPKMAEENLKDDAMPAWSQNPDHPTLLTLGTVDLIGNRGERPARAVGQCMEYCAWLLLHPGSTPTAMVRELLVAEGTRRSNMSRLRSWLGNDPSNSPYLPDAYSGHIALAPHVTSDWERFQSLLAGGVNRSSTPLLRQALSLVRGQPLDGVAFQWPWAAEWITDMLSMISDAAVAMADRCITDGDLEMALWAIGQGQLAMADDETLAVRRILVLALKGDHQDVDEAVTLLTRSTRAGNRDLSPESIHRVQHALHLNMSHLAGS